MIGDGESMSLVSDALHQMKCVGAARQFDRIVGAFDVIIFLSTANCASNGAVDDR